MNCNQKKVVVFGVFDRLHPGHIEFFRQAGEYGAVTAVVARDGIVERLKGRRPLQSEHERLKAVLEVEHVRDVVLGDEETGMYSALSWNTPMTVCLGYDQDALYSDLFERIARGELPEVEIIRLQAHKPEKYHTSLLVN